MRQVITTSGVNPVAPNSQTTFEVIYQTADPQDETLTGLGLRLHYDSSEVNIALEDVFSTGLNTTPQNQADNENFDNDPNTDRLINVLWINLGGNWPGEGNTPTTLYTVRVETLNTFDGTTFNLTASTTATGFELDASPILVESNDPPTATADNFTTDEDTAFTTGNVLDNDSNPDESDTLSVSAIDTSHTQGQVTDNGDGTFDYNPNGQFESLAAGETATDSFSYIISDENATSTATVTVTINGVNDLPAVTADSFTTNEDTAFTTGNVLDNDSDPDDSDTLSVSAINTDNTQGQVTDNGDGTFEYNPNGQFELTG
jgi:VCBS repeat-containing protein